MHMCMTSSIMHMCMISTDRYTGISDPLRRRAERRVPIGVRIGAVWLVSITIGCPLFVLGLVQPEHVLNSDLQCAIFNKHFIVYGSLVAFYGPLGVMVVTFALTVRLLQRQGNQLGLNHHHASSSSMSATAAAALPSPADGSMRRCKAKRRRQLNWSRYLAEGGDFVAQPATTARGSIRASTMTNRTPKSDRKSTNETTGTFVDRLEQRCRRTLSRVTSMSSGKKQPPQIGEQYDSNNGNLDIAAELNNVGAPTASGTEVSLWPMKAASASAWTLSSVECPSKETPERFCSGVFHVQGRDSGKISELIRLQVNDNDIDDQSNSDDERRQRRSEFTAVDEPSSADENEHLSLNPLRRRSFSMQEAPLCSLLTSESMLSGVPLAWHSDDRNRRRFGIAERGGTSSGSLIYRSVAATRSTLHRFASYVLRRSDTAMSEGDARKRRKGSAEVVTYGFSDNDSDSWTEQESADGRCSRVFRSAFSSDSSELSPFVAEEDIAGGEGVDRISYHRSSLAVTTGSNSKYVTESQVGLFPKDLTAEKPPDGKAIFAVTSSSIFVGNAPVESTGIGRTSSKVSGVSRFDNHFAEEMVENSQMESFDSRVPSVGVDQNSQSSKLFTRMSDAIEQLGQPRVVSSGLSTALQESTSLEPRRRNVEVFLSTKGRASSMSEAIPSSLISETRSQCTRWSAFCISSNGGTDKCPSDCDTLTVFDDILRGNSHRKSSSGLKATAEESINEIDSVGLEVTSANYTTPCNGDILPDSLRSPVNLLRVTACNQMADDIDENDEEHKLNDAADIGQVGDDVTDGCPSPPMSVNGSVPRSIVDGDGILRDEKDRCAPENDEVDGINPIGRRTMVETSMALNAGPPSSGPSAGAALGADSTTGPSVGGRTTFRSLVKKHGAAFQIVSIFQATRENRQKKAYNTVKTERKAVRVLGAMFAIFVTCWTPFFTVNLVMGLCRECHINVLVYKVFLWFGYASCTLNPVVYTIFNRGFRTIFVRLLKCRRPCGTRGHVEAAVRLNRLQLLASQNPGLVTGTAALSQRGAARHRRRRPAPVEDSCVSAGHAR